MPIYGTALLAACTLLGAGLGEMLGKLLHVRANVGGVGFAMLFLIAAKIWLHGRGALTPGLRLGVEFWAFLYVPIVVAMAASQNVMAAIEGGPMALLIGCAVVAACFLLVGAIGRVMGRIHD